jgi:hypothetical protein
MNAAKAAREQLTLIRIFEELCGRGYGESCRGSGRARSRRIMNRVKLLAWDGSGMVLVTKWLHKGALRSAPSARTSAGPSTREMARPLSACRTGYDSRCHTTRANMHIRPNFRNSTPRPHGGGGPYILRRGDQTAWLGM